MVHNKSRRGSRNFLQVLSLNIIDFHFLISTSLGVVGGQRPGFLEDAVREFLSLSLYNDMGSRDSLCVEPPVAAVGELEVQFLVLIVVLSDIDMESVAGEIVERTAGDLHLLAASVVAFDIAVLRELLLDLHQVFLQPCDVHGGADGFQMVDLRLCLGQLFGDSLIGTFLLIILVEIPLRVLLGRHGRIQRDRNFCIVVIIQTLKTLFPAGKSVSVGV